MTSPARIGVVGAGAWGTALAQLIADREPVLLWARNAALAAAINRDGVNATYAPHVALRPGITATSETVALSDCEALLMVTPLQHMRSILGQLPLAHRPALVLCAKGIEAGTGLLPHEIAVEAAPHCPVALLSGPTFSHDVMRGNPVACAFAAAGCSLLELLMARLGRPWFRLYSSDDLAGVAVGGAVKNVIAIACGVATGRALGESARAAIVSRGLAEMVRYAAARGGRPATLSGLSGLGDLVLTCGSTTSRNMALGDAIGRGGEPAALLGDRRTVAEGAATAPVLAADARARGIEMPIAQAVADLLAGTAPATTLIEGLLSRASARE